MANNPPNKATVDFPHPSVIVDTEQLERSSSFTGTYRPIEPGTLYPLQNHSAAEAALYSGAIFLQQRAGKDNEFQERVWATLPSTQDIYNYAISYSGEANAYPIFKRQYLELRDTYAPRTKGTAFTGIYAITITAQGLNYKNPIVTIHDSGTGSGATAIAVIDPSTGKIVKITLKTEGQNYTTATATATISDSGGGTGSGATCTVVIQPATCVLTKEDAVPSDAPWGSLFHLVTRTYETLPGPIIISYEQDPETFASVEVQRQRVLASSVSPAAGAPGSDIAYQGIDTVVSLKTTRSISTAQPNRSDWRSSEFSFPTRLYGITGSAAEGTDGTTILMLNNTEVTGTRKRVLVRCAVTYTTSEGAPNDPFNFPTQDLIFNGPFFSVNERAVLNDAISLTYTTGTDNPQWPDFVEAVDFPASAVSATQYDAMIGTEILIGGEIDPWRYSMFRATLNYTKIRA